MKKYVKDVVDDINETRDTLFYTPSTNFIWSSCFVSIECLQNFTNFVLGYLDWDLIFHHFFKLVHL